mgnify:CR=1 FL=1
MTANARIAWGAALAVLVALPFVYRDPYHLHLLILILIWSFAYTSWSMMGRFGLVSLGHGGFMGVGLAMRGCGHCMIRALVRWRFAPARLRKAVKDPQADMHPETAAKYGIADGDWMWIETRRGRMRPMGISSAGGRSLRPGASPSKHNGRVWRTCHGSNPAHGTRAAWRSLPALKESA